MPKTAYRQQQEMDYRERGKNELLQYHQNLGKECDGEIILLLRRLDLPTKMGMRQYLRGLANDSKKVNYGELPLDEIMRTYEETGEGFTTSQLLERLAQLQPELLEQQRDGIITPRSLSTYIAHLKKKGEQPYNRIVEAGRAPDKNRVFKIQPQE